MQIAKHDFYFNFNASVKGNDPRLAHNIVMNEYASIIKSNPKAVISALNNAGMKTPEGASAGTIIYNLFNAPDKKAVSRNMTKLIRLKAMTISKGQTLSADALADSSANTEGYNAADFGTGTVTDTAAAADPNLPQNQTPKANVWQTLLKLGEAALSGYSSSKGATGLTPTQQAAANKAQLEAMAKARGANVGLGTGGWIAIILGVSLLGVMAYELTKKK